MLPWSSENLLLEALRKASVQVSGEESVIPQSWLEWSRDAVAIVTEQQAEVRGDAIRVPPHSNDSWLTR